jgi:hypothetical protein
MAASRTTLLLLGLVVLATLSAGAEAHTCKTCPSNGGLLGLLEELKVVLDVDLTQCKSTTLQVLLEAAVLGERAKGIKVCAAGEVTVLGPLAVHCKAPGLLGLKVELLNKKGKVVAKLVVDIPLVEAVLELVGDVYHLALEVVEDLEHKKLLFLCGDVQLYALDISIYLHLLGINVGLGVHLP